MDEVERRIKALGGKDEVVRRAAARALRDTGDPRAVKPLIRALEDKNVRQSVASALGKIGDPRAVETLTQALGDKDMVVRKAAGRALEKIQKK